MASLGSRNREADPSASESVRGSSAGAAHVSPHRFEDEAAAVLQRLRAALTEVVAGIPNHASTPSELQRSLQVDINLSYKVFRVVNASNSLSAGRHVPGLSALRTFLNAARRVGVREQVIAAAKAATEEFDKLVVSHAGDRPTFDSMVSALTDTSDAAQISLQHRRAIFRGQRHILGVQARVLLRCFLIQPAADLRRNDIATLSGVLGLRQLRPEAPLVISRGSLANADGTPQAVQREPLDPQADPESGMALLPEFCSEPLPRYRTVRAGPGMICGELVSNGIGKKAAITCIEGHVARAVLLRYREGEDVTSAYNARVRIPCETLVLDVLVHEEAFGPPKPPTAFTCAEYQGELMAASASAEWMRLKPHESVAHLGRGLSVLYTPDFPSYADLGRYAFERLGWDAERFDVYRCRVEYPLLPSTVAMVFDLPEAPSD